MRNFITVIALAIAAMTLAPADAADAPTAPWFAVRSCADHATNCYNDATKTKQPDYSFYKVQIQGKTCTIYWDRAMRRSNHCR